MLHSVNNKKGAAVIEILFEFLFVMSLILCFVALWKPFIQKQNLDYMAKTLVRAVETNGAIDDSITALANELKTEMGIDPDIKWEADYIRGTNKIQIKSKFKLTLTDTAYIKLFEPTFSAPVQIPLKMDKTFTGISQVYWKT